MPADLKSMSHKQLTKFRKDVDKALEKLKATELKTARSAAAKAAAAYGFSLDELIGNASSAKTKRKSTKPRAPSKPMYANPADKTQTWTGKGRRPQWFKDAVQAGTSPDSLSI